LALLAALGQDHFSAEWSLRIAAMLMLPGGGARICASEGARWC
jgi:hypothetical protein